MSTPQQSFAAIIPAAGLGTRMKSSLPKFLLSLCGRTMITHIAFALRDVVDEIVVVVGNGKEQVEKEIETSCASFLEKITFVEQKELVGSGDAVATAMTALSDDVANIMVVLGDMPLLTSEIATDIARIFSESSADVLLSSAIVDDPCGYGRVVRNANNDIERIVEDKDCDEKQKRITETNMYPFCFTREFLETFIGELQPNNSQEELYLTDLVEIASHNSRVITSYTYDNPDIALGANDRAQLATLESIMRETINETHMKNGVTMVDPSTTYIEVDVVLGEDVTLLPGVMLQGTTHIGAGSSIGPHTRIVDSTIGHNCVIESSTIKESTLEDDVTVGPYASIRPGTLLCAGSHVGTFVELKKTEVGHGSKVPHLSYLGDATIGDNTNLGAGTITANYDGQNKHPTTIGDDVKTGVNTVLVAPVHVGDGAYTGAGAVVTKDVPEKSLAKGVPAQVTEDWTPPADR